MPSQYYAGNNRTLQINHKETLKKNKDKTQDIKILLINAIPHFLS